jgi:hypothetical protein
MPSATVSAVVVVHDPDDRLLDRALASLTLDPGIGVEVLIVDNASTRSTDRPAQRTLHRPRNDGFAAAVNAGLRNTSGEFVLVLNDDAALLPGALSAMVDRLRTEPRCAAVTPKILLDEPFEPPVIDSCGIELFGNGEADGLGRDHVDRGQFDTHCDVLAVPMTAALYRRVALEHCGPFDERYFLYYEDLDYGLRLRRAGWRSELAAHATAIHRRSASTERLGDRRFTMVQRNLLWCAVINLSAPTALRIWLGRVRVAITGMGRGQHAAQRWQALGQATLGLPSALAARRRLRRLGSPVRKVD